MRVLVGHVQRVAVVVGAVAGVGRARLDRVRDQAVVAELQRRDVRGLREGGLGARLVADAPVVALVVRRLVVHGAAGAEGAGGVDHRGQHLVVDVDQRRGGTGLLDRLGHDHGHAVADVAHLAVGQHRVLGLLHRRAVQAVDQPAAGQAADGLEVLAGEDAHDPRGLGGGRGVERLDARMRVRRAQEGGVGLARQGDVVGVLALTGQEAGVLAPLDRLADEALACVHGVLLLVNLWNSGWVGLRPGRPSRRRPAGPP